MSGRRAVIILLFSLNGIFAFLRMFYQIWESEQAAAWEAAENPEQASGGGTAS